MTPTALVTLVITGWGGFTFKVKTSVPLPVAFEAPKVTVEVAATVGVPVIAPEVVLRLSPAGRPVAV